MAIPVMNEKEAMEKILATYNPFYEEYYAFYSSWFGGIVKTPQLMLVPIDDHMVHRGDGVFEAMKAVSRGVYLLHEHLERLYTSAAKIAIKPPYSLQEMKAIILETLRVADKDHVLIRLYLSRGPGNFSVNPYDSIAPQLYIVITKLIPPTSEKYTKGLVIGKSYIPSKSSWMAQVKSCNYLPNVLMKKEAVDRKLDFVIGLDDDNNFTESATENVMIVDKSGVIVYPLLDNILKGTTMVRACELAEENGMKVVSRPISLDDIQSAREIMITGTSLNILPVVKFENVNIGDGKPGPIAKQLNEWMLADIKSAIRSVVY